MVLEICVLLLSAYALGGEIDVISFYSTFTHRQQINRYSKAAKIGMDTIITISPWQSKSKTAYERQSTEWPSKRHNILFSFTNSVLHSILSYENMALVALNIVNIQHS